MSTIDLQTLHQTVQEHLKAGRNQQANQTLQKIMLAYPRDPRAPFMLGVLSHQANHVEAALDWINKSISLDPSQPEPFFYRGLIHQQMGQLQEAVTDYRQCLSRRPGDGRALNNMGRAILDLGDVTGSVTALRQAVSAAPQNAGAWNNLGEALRTAGDIGEAIEQYRKAIGADANCAEAHGNLGACLAQVGDRTAGIASMQRAVMINPNLFNAHCNLARTYITGGPLDEAIRHCRRALEINQRSASAIDLMANLLGLAGLVPQSIQARQQAMQLKPNDAAIHSNLLLSLWYVDDWSPRSIFEEHRNWARRHAPGMTPPPDVVNPQGRRLRIGYLSPNFNAHSVAYFFEPVLNAHDRSVVEIFCYSTAKGGDGITARIRKSADYWRDIAGRTDADAVALIKQDKLDILVDLAGHSAENRLPLFDQRPAPIQMTWLGYPASTGMSAMDYRITDEIADAFGPTSDTIHTERLLRIPGGCWVYQAPLSPPVAPFPATGNGFVTFGSFNNLPKVTPRVLETWAKILETVPNSRLILKATGLGSALGREYVQSTLSKLNIAPHRIELFTWLPNPAAHLELYNRIDIALDTFPYNGTTTTCEALWMGVPVITFPGSSHASRTGAALLSHAGCAEWIAKDVDGYVNLAVRLAANIRSIPEVRQNLRSKLQASTLCNAPRLARELEKTYLQILKRAMPVGG